MKMKTSKISSKRFKKTKSGKLMRHHQNTRHLRRNKSKPTLRRLDKNVQVAQAMERKIQRFLPFA